MSNPIVKALEHAAEKLGKTLGKDAGKAVEDMYHGAGTRLKKVATNHAENDAKHAREMEQLLKGGKEDMPHATGSGPPGGRESSGGARDQAENDPHQGGRWPYRPRNPIRVDVLGGK